MRPALLIRMTHMAEKVAREGGNEAVARYEARRVFGPEAVEDAVRLYRAYLERVGRLRAGVGP